MQGFRTEYITSDLEITPIAFGQQQSVKSIFGHLSDQPFSLLLDTAQSDKSNGRYDILLWDPAYTITAKAGVTTLNHCATADSQELSVPPLAVVDELMNRLICHTPVPQSVQEIYANLPFVLGAAGLCSYDLGRYYETLPSTNPDEYQCPELAIGIYHKALIFDNQQQQWYFCKRENEATPDFSQWPIKTRTQSFTLTTPWQSNLHQQDYHLALETIHDYLVAGDCYQVNMAQRFHAQYQGDIWQAFCHLSEQNSAPFSAFMKLPHSTVLSISPERFIKVENGIVQSKPIKGTRPRAANPRQDQQNAQALLSSEKDRAENLMIVDLLRNDISKHCEPGSVKVPALFALESYAAVHHMVSTVTGKLDKNSSPLTLLAGAFPGGSITGAPKIRAMEIIEELEPNRRSVYCGSMMYFGLKKDLDSSICIRTLLAENDTLYCWAGGGIVLDSVATEEYQETLDKVAKILPELEQLRG